MEQTPPSPKPFAVILLIAGIIMTAVGGYFFVQDQRFETSGREVTGVITRDSEVASASDRGTADTIFRSYYRFSLPDGMVQEGTSQGTGKYFKGQKVTIQYLPGAQHEHRIKPEADDKKVKVWLFGGLGMAFLILGMYLFIYHRYRQGKYG